MNKKKRKPASTGKFRKSSPESIVYIEEIMTGVDCEKRKMFGFPAYFVNGNMFTGLFADDLFFRVDPETKEASLKSNPKFKLFEPLPGRFMKEYLAMPDVRNEKKEVVKKITRKSMKVATALPVKKKK